ncbi:FIST signal transduction protein [Merismopedia glauca]|uniref:Histidine kinase n=1 Tax=Merismopedia glauca CCAP 1448/3 TaxID=1296344 RepID=A0A2T1BXB5_9CYAN|nr:FIST N-terminal domain-containing protein [Merismopedia glauca]PSB00632.1 hypothetical protein C7B64_22470 [Merismopedia glauca CCAP 1448/3]
MLKIVVGHSNDPDSLEAVNEVLMQCQASLEGHIPQAGILFAAIDFEHSLILQKINRVFPGIELIGGSTDGELSSVLGFEQDSLTLMLFSSDNLEIKAAVGRNVSQNPPEIAKKAADDAKQQLTRDLKFCIAIPESLTTSIVSILQGLEDSFGKIPVFGGATADEWQYQQTYQFFKTEVLSDAVPMLLFAGDFLFSFGIAGGWHPIGKRSIVTKVDRNIIYEIDNEPALNFYHYYFNNSAPDALYPLAVFPPNETEFFLRGSLGHDSLLGTIKVSGDIPENSTVQITDASLDDVITASKASCSQALANYPGEKPKAALFFSCAWRRQVLGTRAVEEYQTIADFFDPEMASCGFYTYGEIAPLSTNQKTFFHNNTFVTLLMGDR